jgi:hypothetical protein
MHALAVEALDAEEVLGHAYCRDTGYNTQMAGSTKALRMKSAAAVNESDLSSVGHKRYRRTLCVYKVQSYR